MILLMVCYVVLVVLAVLSLGLFLLFRWGCDLHKISKGHAKLQDMWEFRCKCRCICMTRVREVKVCDRRMAKKEE